MSSLDDQILNTEVDLDEFETFVAYAKQLHDYVHYDLLSGKLAQERWSPDETGGEHTKNPFGDFDESARIKRSVIHKRSEMTERVRALDHKLEQLLAGMQRIAEEYKSVEALNGAEAARLRSLLTTPPPDQATTMDDQPQGIKA